MPCAGDESLRKRTPNGRERREPPSSVDSELISPLAQTLLLGFETQDLLKFRNREGNKRKGTSGGKPQSRHVGSDEGRVVPPKG